MLKMDVVTERHNKRVERYKALGRWIYTHRHGIFTTSTILALTAVMMQLSYIERGYFAIGGECLIPAIAVLFYVADKTIERERNERD